MAPNKLMGPVEKTPDVSVETGHLRPEVGEDGNEETVPFPVKADDVNIEENDVENESETPRRRARHLPIDRGWAWVVLASAMLYLSLIGGMRKNLGIFFVNFQDRFNSSAALTTSLTMAQCLVQSVASLLVMTVGMQYMNTRISIMIGSCLTTAAYLISAFASEIRLLYLSFGFMEGLGIAMIHAPVTACIGEYFEKKRGFANGMAYSGASFGGLLFAPIITALFVEYGYSGTMMIVAGMAFNMMISGALMRPMSFYEKRLKSENKKDGVEANIGTATDVDGVNIKLNTMIPNGHDGVIDNGVNTDYIKSADALHRLKDDERKSKTSKHQLPSRLIVRSDSHDPSQVRNLQAAASPLLLRQRSIGARHRTVSETAKASHPFNIVESLSRSRVALYSSSDVVYGSVVDIKEVTRSRSVLAEADPNKDSLCVKIKKSLIQAFRVLFDKSLLKNHVFQLYMFMAFMVAPSNVFLCVSLAPHAKDLGISSTDVGLLLSVLSGCGTASRVLTALCSDRKFFNLTTVLAGASLCVGVVANLVRLVNSYPTLIVFAGVLGFCCEIYQAIFAVILVEYLTLPKLKSCLGFANLIHGASFATVFQLVGFMRDATGSYYMSYHVLGAMEIVGAICAMALPLVHRKYNVRRDATNV